MSLPRLQKIVVNMGVGSAVAEKKNLEDAVAAMTQITGQKPLVTKALARIPPSEAQLLETFHYDRLKMSQLAELHGISERAVEGRLRRARERLLQSDLGRALEHAYPVLPTVRVSAARLAFICNRPSVMIFCVAGSTPAVINSCSSAR